MNFFKRTNVRYFLLLCIIGFILLFTAFPKTFTVVDGETGKPIQDAAIIAWWIGYKGLPGFSYGYTAKIVEDVTDKDGKFTVPAFFGFNAIFTPYLKVYKRGYVGWYDERIFTNQVNPHMPFFPITARRTDFTYESGQTITLEPWKEGYSRARHYSYISDLPSPSPSTTDKVSRSIDSPYDKAIDWERLLAVKERIQYKNEQKKKDFQ